MFQLPASMKYWK